MQVRNISSVFFSLILAFGVLLPSAHASEWNQMTKLSFNRPVEIPREILPAGTYWFVLANGAADRNIVEVFNRNRTRLFATLITVPAYRSESTSNTEINLAERPANKPQAILKWYYPGRLTGHEFLYRPKHEREFAHDMQVDVVGTHLKTRP